jgi:hypothetical protein
MDWQWPPLDEPPKAGALSETFSMRVSANPGYEYRQQPVAIFFHPVAPKLPSRIQPMES